MLRDFSFEAAPGEVFGILASDDEYLNGVLRIIAGIEKADSGTIFLDGRMLKKSEHSVGYFTDDSASRWREFFGKNNSDNYSITRMESLERAIDSMSRVFLVENPVQSLDSTNTKRIAELLRKRTRETGAITIVASNDPQEIFQTCDVVGIMHGGEIIQIGKPETVYSQPESIAAAKVFGEINLISAKRLTSNKMNVPIFFTELGEHKLSTENVEKTELGAINQSVTLAVRPEYITLSFGASFPADNLIRAKVTDIEFRGSLTSVTLDSAGLQLTALVLRVVGLNIEEECVLGIPPSKIRILTK